MIFSARLFLSTKCLFSLFVLVGLSISNAIADAFDTFNVVVGSSYQHDDNLYRLPSNLQPSTVGAQRSDNVLRNSIGFRLNKKYSLQEFKVTYDHVDTQYDNSTFLNFKANNYSAAWLWSITPHLKGELYSEQTVALVPFQDLRFQGNTSPSAFQNFRTTDVQRLSLDFSPYDKWHAIGSYSKITSENSRNFIPNSQTLLPETSFTLNSVDGGVKYVFPSQSYFSLVSRYSNGENSVFNSDPNIAVGKGYLEKQQELSSFWLISGKSRLTSNIGHLSRTDDNFAIRDFSGLFGGVNYDWDATGKVTISFALSRKLTSFLVSNASYSISNTFSVKPTWYATSKITVRPSLEVSSRSFEGPGPQPNNFIREDSNLSYGISVDWSPRNLVKLGLSLQHYERNSNGPALDYSANTASVNGQLTF